MIKHLTYVILLAAAPVGAQSTAGGVVGGGAMVPYTPAGIPPAGTTPSGLGAARTPGSAVMPALPQPSTGVTPPIGGANTGTIGDGRVGTLAPGANTPGVNGTTGTPVTSGVSNTTPTTNPPPH